MAAAVAFPDLHSIGRAVGNRVNRLEPSGSELVEVLPVDLEDAPVAAQPEVILPILKNLVDHVVKQPVLGTKGCELAVPEPVQATAISANPEGARAIFI